LKERTGLKKNGRKLGAHEKKTFSPPGVRSHEIKTNKRNEGEKRSPNFREIKRDQNSALEMRLKPFYKGGRGG